MLSLCSKYRIIVLFFYKKSWIILGLMNSFLNHEILNLCSVATVWMKNNSFRKLQVLGIHNNFLIILLQAVFKIGGY